MALGDLSNEMKSSISECYSDSSLLLANTQKFVSKFQDQSTNSKNEFNLLNMKNQGIISCLTNSALVLCKLSMGETIEDEKIVELFAKHRELLEKMKKGNPKIKLQVERLLGEEEKGSMRARPDTLVMDSDDNDDEDDDENEDESECNESGEKDNNSLDEDSEIEDKKAHKQKFATQKLDKTEDNSNKNNFRINRMKKRALNSSLIKDFQQEYGDKPEEIVEGRDVIGDRFERSRKQKQKYEEDYFMRLPENKRHKHFETRKMERGGLDSILSFGKYMVPNQSDFGNDTQGRKRKGGVKRKGGPSAKRKSGAKGKKRRN